MKKRHVVPVPEEAAAVKEEETAGTGPSMTQFERLVATVDEIKSMIGLVAAKQQAGQEPEAEEGQPIVLTGMSVEEKYDIVTRALPLDSNIAFTSVLSDPNGPQCLRWALELALNRAVAAEGVTYDTASEKSALASKVIHILFSISYVKQYKSWDPRDDYVQTEGTAMHGDVYNWLRDSMESITTEFYNNFQMATMFVWEEFYKMFRKVWRWTKSNNSDNRKERRAARKKRN